MDISQIKVSVITPSFNDELFIAQTIESVLSQTHRNLELIIIDDKSTDSTKSVIKSFKDERIRFYENHKNRGPAFSRNRAISLATGDYIAFLDGDDLWCKDKLEKQLKFMVDNDYAFSCTDYELINKKGEPLGIRVSGPDVITRKKLVRTNYIGCLTAMYKRSACKKLEIPNTIKKRNDYALWLKLSKKLDCHFLHENLAKYRKRRSSISSTSKVFMLKYHYQVYRKVCRFSAFKSFFRTCFSGFYYLLRNLKYYSLVKGENITAKEGKLVNSIFVAVSLTTVVLFYLFGYSAKYSTVEANFLYANSLNPAGERAHLEFVNDDGSYLTYDKANRIAQAFYDRKDVYRVHYECDSNAILTFNENTYIARLGSVPVYSDNLQMEFLNIPLYRSDSSLRSGAKYKAKYGSYIPSSIADQMVDDFGLSGYDELLEIHDYFSIDIGGNTTTMSINNIYLNNETKYWNDRQIEDEYYKYYAKWSNNSIFSACKDYFNEVKKVKAYVDYQNGYENIRHIATKSISINEADIKFTLYQKDGGTYQFTYSPSSSNPTADLGSTSFIMFYVSFGILLFNFLVLLTYIQVRRGLLKLCLIILPIVFTFMLVGEILKSLYFAQMWPLYVFNPFGAILTLLLLLHLVLLGVLFKEEPKKE